MKKDWLGGTLTIGWCTWKERNHWIFEDRDSNIKTSFPLYEPFYNWHLVLASYWHWIFFFEITSFLMCVCSFGSQLVEQFGSSLSKLLISTIKCSLNFFGFLQILHKTVLQERDEANHWHMLLFHTGSVLTATWLESRRICCPRTNTSVTMCNIGKQININDLWSSFVHIFLST